VKKEGSINNITLCSYLPDRRGAYRDLVRRPEGRLRRTWGDNIKMDLQEVGWRHGLD
jgi:hypothetical protein